MTEWPADAGKWLPLIDHGRCEATSECVRVCPYNVFEVRRIDAKDYAALPLLGRLKNRVHGRRTAAVSLTA